MDNMAKMAQCKIRNNRKLELSKLNAGHLASCFDRVILAQTLLKMLSIRPNVEERDQGNVIV